jgi:hypothetical protein
MILKNKFAVIAGAAVVAGGLLTGVAFAASAATTAPATGTTASAPSTTAPATGTAASPEAKKAQHEQNEAARLAQAVKDGKLTQGEADLHAQIDALRDAAMTKVQSDSKALVDQAVTDGKITQAQADNLVNGKGRGGFGHGGGRHGHNDNENGPEGADDQAAPASGN